MYFFENETKDIKFELDFFKYFEEDNKMGNPYNTIINVYVNSYGFCGQSQWTVDFKDFKKFIIDLRNLYENLRGDLQFKDREYDSILKIKCGKLGQISFSGILIDNNFQKMEFNFDIDQTYLKNFVEKLYKDFHTNERDYFL